MPTRNRRPIHIAGQAVLVALALSLLVPSASVAATPATAGVRGTIHSAATRRPVAGAIVALPELHVRTSSAADGSFSFAGPPATSVPYRRITAVVTAPGFGRWTIRGVPLSPNDTLELNVELRETPIDHTVLTPMERSALPRGPLAVPSGYTFTCTGWGITLVPPPTIKVYLTQQIVSQQYDFAFYLTHVLPNEWIPSWDADALGAGAMAAKSFGMYREQPGHAYSGGTGCADVTDSVQDQVFDPTWSTAATDQAVYATLGTILLKGNAIQLTHYFAGAPSDPCAAVQGQYTGWMSQWGTQTCGLQKVLWPAIVTTFYTGYTERYVGNLLLDANLQTWQTYAWLTGTGTTYARTASGGYGGLGFLTVTPPPSAGNGMIYESRPVTGAPTTTYAEQAALRCGTQNATSCSIVLRLSCVPANGATFVNRYTVSVPNDGVWRIYSYNPPAAGIAHVTAQLSLISGSTFDATATVLTAPYGGP